MRDDAVLGRALPLDRGLGPVVREESGKIACVIGLCNCCCNIVSGQKYGELFGLDFLVFILFSFKLKVRV